MGTDPSRLKGNMLYLSGGEYTTRFDFSAGFRLPYACTLIEQTADKTMNICDQGAIHEQPDYEPRFETGH